MAELAARGLAREEVRNGQRFHRLSAEGAKILSDTMARNGRRAKQWRENGSPATGS